MVFKLLALLLSTSAFAGTLRTATFQQSLSASAPRNYILNSGAELNDRDVNDPPNIVSRTTTVPLEGDASFAIDGTASAQVAVFYGKPLQSGLLGGTCEMRFRYNGDGTLYKAYATLNGVKVSAEQTLTNITSPSSAQVSLIFPCGTSTTDTASANIESTSSSAAAIKVDSVYIGSAVSLGAVSQSEHAGTASRSGSQAIASAADTKVQLNSGSFAFGTFDGTTNYRYTPGKPGNYQIHAKTYLDTLPSGAFVQISIRKNGSTEGSCTVFGRWNMSSSDGVWQTTCTVVSDSDDYFEFWVQSSDTSYTVQNASVFFARLPLASETILRQDAPGAQWTAFTPSTSFSANVTWTGFYRCSMNHLEAQYNAAFTGATTTAALTANLPTNFTVDTARLPPNATTTNLYVGRGLVYDFGVDTLPISAILSSTTAVTLRAESASGTYVSNGTGASQAVPVTVGNNDTLNFKISVPVTADSPCYKGSQALIPGTIYSNSGGIERIERMTGSSACALSSQSGSWLTSVSGTNSGTGCTLNIASGMFSAAPTCSVTMNSAGGATCRITTPFTTSSGVIGCIDTASQAGSNQEYTVICMGPR